MKVDLPKTSSQYDNNEDAIYEHEDKYISFSQSQNVESFKMKREGI